MRNDDLDRTLYVQVEQAREAERLRRDLATTEEMLATQAARKLVDEVESTRELFQAASARQVELARELAQLSLPGHAWQRSMADLRVTEAMTSWRRDLFQSFVTPKLELAEIAESLLSISAQQREQFENVGRQLADLVGVQTEGLKRVADLLSGLDLQYAPTGQVVDADAVLLKGTVPDAVVVADRPPAERGRLSLGDINLITILSLVITLLLAADSDADRQIIIEQLDDLTISVQGLRGQLRDLDGEGLPATHLTSRSLILHEQPSAESKSIMSLKRAESVTCLRAGGDWVFSSWCDVEGGAIASGWLYARYLRPLEPVGGAAHD